MCFMSIGVSKDIPFDISRLPFPEFLVISVYFRKLFSLVDFQSSIFVMKKANNNNKKSAKF